MIPDVLHRLKGIVLAQILQLLGVVLEFGVDLKQVDSAVLPPRGLLIQYRSLYAFLALLLRKEVIVLVIIKGHLATGGSLHHKNVGH